MTIKISVLFTALSLVSTLTFSENSSSTLESINSDLNYQYICDSLITTYEQITNAYCTSDINKDIERQCDGFSFAETQCQVSKENEAKLLISLNMQVVPQETPTKEKQKIDIRDGMSVDPKELVIGHFDTNNNFESKDMSRYSSEEESPKLISTELKCVNSIKNTWHCGFASVSHFRRNLSKANNELKVNLDKELLKRAEAATSRL